MHFCSYCAVIESIHIFKHYLIMLPLYKLLTYILELLCNENRRYTF